MCNRGAKSGREYEGGKLSSQANESANTYLPYYLLPSPVMQVYAYLDERQKSRARKELKRMRQGLRNVCKYAPYAMLCTEDSSNLERADVT